MLYTSSIEQIILRKNIFTRIVSLRKLLLFTVIALGKNYEKNISLCSLEKYIQVRLVLYRTNSRTHFGIRVENIYRKTNVLIMKKHNIYRFLRRKYKHIDLLVPVVFISCEKTFINFIYKLLSRKKP